MDRALPISERIPITVGIVGHLDVIATDEHMYQIEKLFKDLAVRYPCSPVHLFSSIAEGADRFVANIFMRMKRENEKYRDRFELIVPMPFTAEEYREDFDDYSDREFDELLKQAKRSFIVPDDSSETGRPGKYLRTGKLVADSSLILMAMWDGKGGQTGGTADIVKYKMTGNDDSVSESTFEYDGSVFVLPSERKQAPGNISKNPVTDKNLSLDNILKDLTLKNALNKIEEINSYSVRLDRGGIKKSKEYLFDETEKLEPSERLVMDWYSILDQMAVKTRRRDLKITGWMFTLSLLFVFTLEIYSNILTWKIILAVSMFVLISTAALFIFSRVKNDHKKYLYSRTLAEGLRIQFFWNIAGINENVSDCILRIHSKGFTWVKHILSALQGVSFNRKNINDEIIKDLTKNWIKDQLKYFDASVKIMRERIAYFHRVSNFFLFLSILLFLSIFFLGNFFIANFFMLNIMLVIAPIMLGIFALIRAYIKTKAYEQLLNQYEIMQVIYNRAEIKTEELNRAQMKQEERLSYFKELFYVIGKEALIENGIWYLIFKDKEPEIEV
ncbi:MAG TPA: hypothetical protein ENH59_04095 [Bacteroidetes bacterium]|nr:hypothetical protein [Bacteroidota bacterium]